MSCFSTLLVAVAMHAAVAQDVVAPQVLTTAPALYPAGHTDGATVDLVITLDANGVITAVDVEHTGGQDFDAAATQAVRAWTFAPARRAGEPTAARIKVPFVFTPPPPPAPAPTVVASPAATAASPAPEASQEVTIRTAPPPLQRGASDFHIEVGQLAVIAKQKPADLLQLAPGIFVANEGGSGHAEQVFLRGFDAGQGQAIEFTLGGVPINEVDNTDAHGYADTHFIIPELVKNLRVIEGPFDPHQGDFGEAGSADYQLGVPDRRVEVSGSYGSFGTRRLLALWAPPTEREGTFAAVQTTDTAGYGSNRSATHASAMAQYEGEVGSRGLWHALVTAYGTHYQAAGVVRADRVAQGLVDYDGTEDPSQGGDAQRYTLAFDLENPSDNGALTQQVFLTWRTLRITEDFTGRLLDNQVLGQSYHPQRGDTIEQDYQALTGGARGSYKTRLTVRELPQSLEVGYLARYDHTRPKVVRLETGTQIPYGIDEDLTTDILYVAGYVDLDLHPWHSVTVRGGVRQEYFDYSVLDHCATAGTYVANAPLDQTCPTQGPGGVRLPSQRATATGVVTEPRVTVAWHLSEPFKLTASYGIGAQSQNAPSIVHNTQAPFSRVTAAEGGVTYDQALERATLSGRAVGFYTHVGRDLVFNPLLGLLSNTTAATRTGAVVSLRARGRWFDALFSATYVRATYDEVDVLVPYVPNVIARSDTALFAPIPAVRFFDHPCIGTLGLGLNYIGTRPLPLGQQQNAVFVVDASASVRWQGIKLGLLVQNAANVRYPLTEYFYASNFQPQGQPPTLVPALHYSAAPPLSVLATLSVAFAAEAP